jgi:transcriptional regulator with XRE-family HTH domain
MDVEQWFADELAQAKDRPTFILEGVVIDVTSQMFTRLEDLNLSRAELAERLGVSRQYVTKLLNGKPNLTLKSLVDIALALDMDITVRIGGSQASRDAVLKPAKKAAKARGNGRKKERIAA